MVHAPALKWQGRPHGARQGAAVKVTLIPSSMGPDAASVHPGFFLSSYLIEEAVAIDAGGLGFLGDLDAQSRIKHIFITHSHVDHIASLPIFLETVFESADHCVTVHAGAETWASIQGDIFNDRVWPDFIALSEKGLPFVKKSIIEPGKPIVVEGLKLTPIPVDHVVPTLGFLIEGPGGTVAIPSDTGPTEDFWRHAAAAKDLKAVFLEVSFPDRMEGLARISKHLTPAMFAAEIRKLDADVPFVAVHIKPRFYGEVVDQILALGSDRIEIGRPGKSYTF